MGLGACVRACYIRRCLQALAAAAAAAAAATATNQDPLILQSLISRQQQWQKKANSGDCNGSNGGTRYHRLAAS